MSKEIVITIHDDGSITIEGKNFSGAECEKATAAFERELGEVKKKTRKPEYFAKAAHSASQSSR